MTVIGLDCGTTSAAAFDGETSGVPRFTTYRAPRPTGSSEEGFDYGRTFGGFHRWLSELVQVTKPKAIAMEAPLVVAGRFGAKVATNHSTVRILFGLAAIAELTAHEASVAVYEVNVQRSKKFFAGTGRADKAAMLGRCQQLGWPAGNDHEADAAACWAYLKGLIDPKWSPRSTPLFGLRRAHG